MSDGDDSGPDALYKFKLERRRKFLEFMSLVAKSSDVSVERKQELLRTKAVVLPSERRELPPDSMAFTTTPALIEMAKAWWAEFENRDGDAVSPQVKWRTLFRGSISRNAARVYESPDDLLSLEAPSGPPSGYPWLPTPNRKVEFDERDVRFIESTARLALRASNFSEVILQAWDVATEDTDLLARMKKCLSSVVKTIMQTQLAVANGCLQMRRDHYLASAKGLSHDMMYKLRHAPALSEKRLFPGSVLRDVDDQTQKQLQTKAFLRFTSVSNCSTRGGRGRGRTDEDFRTGQHHSASRPRSHQNSSSWYGPEFRASKIPRPVRPCVPSSKRRGAQMLDARQVVAKRVLQSSFLSHRLSHRLSHCLSRHPSVTVSQRRFTVRRRLPSPMTSRLSQPHLLNFSVPP